MTPNTIWQRWNWDSTYPAPAKLNLFLHVTGRRADGYHLLQTAFRFIDYNDRISFSPRSDNAIVLTHPLPGVPAESDLTVRAARLLQIETGCNKGVNITVEKYLPMGGGLGGGGAVERADDIVARLGQQFGADPLPAVAGVHAHLEGSVALVAQDEPERIGAAPHEEEVGLPDAVDPERSGLVDG